MVQIKRTRFLYFFAVVLFFYLFIFLTKTQALDDTKTVTLSTDVQPAIALSVSSNTYDFGNLTAGTPKKGSSGVIAGVTTNASNGYDLSISDGIAGTNSCMVNVDTVTYIVDFSASIAAPIFWTDGISKGLGATVYSADTSKEAKWGAGTTFNDAANKYAGIPQNSEVIHVSANYKTGEDHTGVAFAVDVNTDQKAGIYSGSATLTATANL